MRTKHYFSVFSVEHLLLSTDTCVSCEFLLKKFRNERIVCDSANSKKNPSIRKNGINNA